MRCASHIIRRHRNVLAFHSSSAIRIIVVPLVLSLFTVLNSADQNRPVDLRVGLRLPFIMLHNLCERVIFNFCNFANDVDGAHEQLVEVSVLHQGSLLLDGVLEGGPDLLLQVVDLEIVDLQRAAEVAHTIHCEIVELAEEERNGTGSSGFWHYGVGGGHGCAGCHLDGTCRWRVFPVGIRLTVSLSGEQTLRSTRHLQNTLTGAGTQLRVSEQTFLCRALSVYRGLESNEKHKISETKL